MKNIAIALLATFIVIPSAMAGRANNTNLPPSSQAYVTESTASTSTHWNWEDSSEKTGGGFAYYEDEKRTSER